MGPELNEALLVWRRSKSFKLPRDKWAEVLNELSQTSIEEVLAVLCPIETKTRSRQPAAAKSEAQLAIENAFKGVAGRKDAKLAEYVSYLPDEAMAVLARHKTFAKVMPKLLEAVGEKAILSAAAEYAAAKASQAKKGGVRPKAAA